MTIYGRNMDDQNRLNCIEGNKPIHVATTVQVTHVPAPFVASLISGKQKIKKFFITLNK